MNQKTDYHYIRMPKSIYVAVKLPKISIGGWIEDKLSFICFEERGCPMIFAKEKAAALFKEQTGKEMITYSAVDLGMDLLFHQKPIHNVNSEGFLFIAITPRFLTVLEEFEHILPDTTGMMIASMDKNDKDTEYIEINCKLCKLEDYFNKMQAEGRFVSMS